MAAKYWKSVGKITPDKKWNNKRKPRTCVICGKQAIIGNLCQSCNDFIKSKKEGKNNVQ